MGGREGEWEEGTEKGGTGGREGDRVYAGSKAASYTIRLSTLGWLAGPTGVS